MLCSLGTKGSFSHSPRGPADVPQERGEVRRASGGHVPSPNPYQHHQRDNVGTAWAVCCGQQEPQEACKTE